MATTIKLATTAQNLDIGITDAVNWNNPELALTSNDLHTVANFNDSTAGVSHYLYIGGFGYSLPSELAIEGIAVNVERKGTGSTEEDYYVALVYEASGLETTSPGKQKPEAWPASDATAQYGSNSDFWNKTWTAEEINSSNFGFAISAEGDPSQNDAAQIDFVEMTIYWHQEVNIVPTGGFHASGSASIKPYIHVPTGGIGVGGEADEFFDNHPQTINDTHFVILASSYEMVPDEPDHGKKVWAHFWIMERTDSTNDHDLHWEIHHGFDETNAKKLHLWKGDRGEAGAFKWLSLGTISSGFSNPIIGSKLSITDTRKDDIIAGRYFLLASSHADPEEFVRAQLEPRQGCRARGTATVSAIREISVGGGTECAGTANVQHDFVPQISGGIEASGSITTENTWNPIVDGGIEISGQSYLSKIMTEGVSGGALVNGSSSDSFVFVPAITGGVCLVGVKGTIAIHPYTSGGIEASGSHDLAFFATPSATGGVQASGQHVQTFIDFYIMQVRVKVGAKKAKSEILKFYDTHHLGYCRAMGSENICTVVTYPKELIPPTNDVSPKLVEGRFRMQHEPGWCDVEEKCEEGTLPKIVQERQGPYLPPKIRRVTPRDRRIATIDAV